MELIGLFPIPVGIYKIEKPLTQKEFDFINNLDRRPNQYNTTSLDTYLFRHKKLAKLKNFFNESVNDFFKKIYCPKTNVKLRLTQSWANFSVKGEGHHSHVHPNSIISAVFYVQTDDKSDKIYFVKESKYNTIDIVSSEFNPFNSTLWWLPASTGTLMVFPSSLGHYVDPVEADKTRISISANTFIVGSVGEEETLTGLTLGE